MKKCDNCHWCHMYIMDVSCKAYDGSGCDRWAPETNYDKIGRMNDVTLAKLITDIALKNDILDDHHLPPCATDPETDPSECESDECLTCPYTILNWLRAPAEQEKA